MSKPLLHPRNRHRAAKGTSYDFPALCRANPALTAHVFTNVHGNTSVDFADPVAVKELNRALLLSFYELAFWDLPSQFLCPPVPGRADYIHHLADLIQQSTQIANIKTKQIKGLDIGTGASLIYPIIGSFEYDWQFVGSDIDTMSINCAKQLVQFNKRLNGRVKLRLQSNSSAIFDGIVKQSDRFTFSMCNPPFHASKQEAEQGTVRKLTNLNKNRTTKVKGAPLNFGGRSNELWCDGGERDFVTNMIRQSERYSDQVLWFTSLISKRETLPYIEKELIKIKAKQTQTFEMAQGNKVSRFVAWSFLTEQEHKKWFE